MNALIVARHTEDTAWTYGAPWPVRIVQKDTDLPNRGREPSSFLWAILSLYDAFGLHDTLAFVQGNPFDHCPDLFDRLHPTEGYVPLGSWIATSDATGGPHHHGLPVAEYHERWLARPFPGEVSFVAGGQFMVSGATILSRPPEFYRRMYDDLMERDGTLPYVAERLWGEVFG